MRKLAQPGEAQYCYQSHRENLFSYGSLNTAKRAARRPQAKPG